MIAFCFVFGKMSSSVPLLLVMLLAHVGKRSKSLAQMFSKTDLLKNFAIFTGKKPVPKHLFDKVSGLKACSFI